MIIFDVIYHALGFRKQAIGSLLQKLVKNKHIP